LSIRRWCHTLSSGWPLISFLFCCFTAMPAGCGWRSTICPAVSTLIGNKDPDTQRGRYVKKTHSSILPDHLDWHQYRARPAADQCPTEELPWRAAFPTEGGRLRPGHDHAARPGCHPGARPRCGGPERENRRADHRRQDLQG